MNEESCGENLEINDAPNARQVLSEFPYVFFDMSYNWRTRIFYKEYIQQLKFSWTRTIWLYCNKNNLNAVGGCSYTK